MRLNLSIPISLTGLAVAAVAIGAYHIFVEALFPATILELLGIGYMAAGLNMYGYYFRFTSLVRPSIYRQRYSELREMAAWTRKKIQANRHLPMKYGRKAVQEEPLFVAWFIAALIGILAKPIVGWIAFVPYAVIGATAVYEMVTDEQGPDNTDNSGGEVSEQ